MTDLNGKVVLVTGSSRGIGAKSQWRSPDRARRSSSTAGIPKPWRRSRPTSPTAAARPCLSPAMLRSSPTSRPFGRASSRPTVWSTCWLPAPAAAAAGPIEDIGEESWRADLDANLTATFLTIKSFLPGMKRRGTGHHHHVIRGRPPGQCPHARGVRGGEGRCPAAHPRPRSPGRSPRHSGQLHRARRRS